MSSGPVGRSACDRQASRAAGLKRPRLGAPQGAAKLPGDTKLDADTVKRVVLERMLYDTSGTTQIEAARLAWQILGPSGNSSGAKEAAQGVESSSASISEAGTEPSSEPAHESAAPDDGRNVSSLEAHQQGEEPPGVASGEPDSNSSQDRV